jgi:glycosyltransferase involved in cell wall biosynthesis
LLKVIFHEYLDDSRRDQILKKCDIGIATYVPGRDNVAYYGDPSKIKQYLSSGLPVITTNVFEFSKEIKKEKAGIIIDYFSNQDLTQALKELTKNINLYSKGATKLAKKYYYKNIYKEFFN